MTKRIYVGLTCLTRGEFDSAPSARGIGTARVKGVPVTIMTRRTYAEAMRRLLDLEPAVRQLVLDNKLKGDPNELSVLSETIVFEGGAGIKFADEGAHRRYSDAAQTALGWCLRLTEPVVRVNEAVDQYAKIEGMIVTHMSQMTPQEVATKLSLRGDESSAVSNRLFTDPFEVTSVSVSNLVARARIRGLLREHQFHTFSLGERFLVASTASMEHAYRRLEKIRNRATEGVETLAIGASAEDVEFMAVATHPVVVRLRGRRDDVFETSLERALTHHGRPPDDYTVATRSGPSGFNEVVLKFLGR